MSGTWCNTPSEYAKSSEAGGNAGITADAGQMEADISSAGEVLLGDRQRRATRVQEMEVADPARDHLRPAPAAAADVGAHRAGRGQVLPREVAEVALKDLSSLGLRKFFVPLAEC